MPRVVNELATHFHLACSRHHAMHCKLSNHEELLQCTDSCDCLIWEAHGIEERVVQHSK